MPTYVYECRACAERVEVVQKMSDAPLTECEKCGGSLRKVLFAPAVVYKGSGFYVTDYKNGGRTSESESSKTGSTATETPKSDAASSGTSTETKTETKTESKPEAKPAAS